MDKVIAKPVHPHGPSFVTVTFENGSIHKKEVALPLTVEYHQSSAWTSPNAE